MSLTFHSAAAEKVKEIMDEDPEVTEDISLRVFIQGGGCSGFQYGFTFDETKDDDEVVVTDGVTLVVDPLSLQYLDGSEIDYSNDHFNSQFIIRNPNVQTTCGCGSSFSA
jgi:iron-sulfur cluster insertion protein|tara:strand:+ start:432 stop:761 length:330 start_codon:yes stop_codon:yes gene_type:complete